MDAKGADIRGELEAMRRFLLRNVDEKTQHVENHLVDVSIAVARGGIGFGVARGAVIRAAVIFDAVCRDVTRGRRGGSVRLRQS